MRLKLRSWWQYIRKYWIIAIVVAIVIIFVLIVYAGYQFHWEWTGLGPETNEPKQHAKTLWDWLNLLGVLAIPVVVGLGAAWYTAQQGKVSEMESTDNQREIALQAYIDRIADLLLENKLREAGEENEERNIARIRTLTVLRRLDTERMRVVIQFLKEAGLINAEKPIVSLIDAYLRGAYLSGSDLSNANLSSSDLWCADLSDANLWCANLSDADLSDANISGADLRSADLRRDDLSRANLSDADLSGAYLNDANLSDADLWCADLSGAYLNDANLSDANLKGANLKGANLSDADLSRTNLRRADLSGATVTQEQLEKAKLLKGAIMPNGSKHS